MNCTQNERINQVSEQTLVIGVDIASELNWFYNKCWGIDLD